MDWQRIQTVENVFNYYMGMPLSVNQSKLIFDYSLWLPQKPVNGYKNLAVSSKESNLIKPLENLIKPSKPLYFDYNR